MRLQKLLLLFLTVCLLQSCQIGRYVYYNYADIKDYKIFPKNRIEKGDQAFSFPHATQPRAPKKYKNDSTGVEMSFDDFLKKDKTVAFLIIHNDSIQYENYFEGYDQNSIVPSFSMAKSVLSMLIGTAIEDGYIHSVSDSIGGYISGIKHKKLRNTTILQLLQMTSGLEFNESYTNPFGHAAGFYYGGNVRRKSKRLKIKKDADFTFDYKSGNSQLLGLVLDNALPDSLTVSDYLQNRIWQPLHMQFDASWSTDDEKDRPMERTFCCLNARALDYAKLGRLYLHKGHFQDRQIIPKNWVERSTKIDTTDGSAWYYQYQWWLPTKNGDFYADGLLGQYIYVNPEKNLIIVRLGKKEERNWPQIFVYLSSLY